VHAESDWYSVLGLDRRCTADQIRTAYRLLAKRHHPDVNQGASEAVTRLQELNAAYETLSDPVSRRAYDRKLAAAASPPVPKATGKIKRDISQGVRLRIEDFLRGVSIVVRVNDPANPDGEEVYQLEIPGGTAPNAKFKIPRHGRFAGGFVIVRVGVLPGFRFKAKGFDLRGDLRISASRAKQGGMEMVTGPAGNTLRVRIPAGVGRDEIVRVAGEGLPKPRGGRGDLQVRIVYRPEVRITRR
jgi:DnaJ-class molecular chaperone